MPRSIARAGARAGPSVTSQLRCFSRFGSPSVSSAEPVIAVRRI